MSRDFKPFEQYLTDEDMDNNIRNARWVLVYNNEEKEVPINEVLKKRFPELHFLLGEERLSRFLEDAEANNPYRDIMYSLLDEIEKNLQQEEASLILAIDNKNKDYLSNTTESLFQTLFNHSKDYSLLNSADASKAWFYGCFDREFYYCEENTNLFVNYIYGKCRSLWKARTVSQNNEDIDNTKILEEKDERE